MRHNNYIKLCLKLTNKSNFIRYRHAAIIVKSGRILATGINKNKTGVLKSPYYQKKKLHAELDVLIKFSPKKLKGAILYVAGKTEAGTILRSCPCEACQKLIKDYQLKAVYYSNEYGEPELLQIGG